MNVLSSRPKASVISGISDAISPALHPQKSSQRVRACAANDVAYGSWYKLGEVKKKKNGSRSRPLHFLGPPLFFLLFVISNVCTNKTQQALLLLYTQFPTIEFKEKSKYKRDGVCVLIRTQPKISKPWYARSAVDRSITLQYLFCKFASGEFDDGGKTSIFEHR